MHSEDTTLLTSPPQIIPEPNENGKFLQAQILIQQLALVPVGPGQMAGVPHKLYRVPVDKKTLGEFIKAAQTVYDDLESPSDLAIASNMAEAQQFAQQQKGILGV